MPTIQLHNLPEHLYNKIIKLAKENNRSIAQETIILLEKALKIKRKQKKNRKKLLNRIINETKSDTFDNVTDPVPLIRKDRNRS